MKAPKFPHNEVIRLDALCSLDILDSPAEERFDRLTRIAQRHFQVDISLVSIVDADRQWFKSRQGLDASETPRNISFCGHAILGDDVFYVPNALEDPRFTDNPLVTGPPHIRFYAGAPLSSPDGLKMGTLCVIDNKPRNFNEEDFQFLSDLAASVETELSQQALQQFKTTLDLTLDCVFMFFADNLRFYYANRGAFEQVGYTSDELLSLHPYDIKPKVSEGEFHAIIAPLLSGEQASITFETEHQHKNGSRLPVEIFLQYQSPPGERARFVAIVRDITERKKGEQTLRDREGQLSAILNNVVDGIITIDDRGIVETYNLAAEHIFGYLSHEVVGHNVNMLMPSPYQAEHDGYLKHYNDTGEARIIGIGREVEGLRKDGSTFPLELAIGAMSVGDRQKFTGIVRDITDRKQAEKMKREFVSTVSHELRTPLTSIKGSLGLIKSGAFGTFPDKLTRLLDIAHNNSDRLVRLINDILDIEKIESGKMDFQMGLLDLNVILSESIEANKAYGDERDVVFSFKSELPDARVSGDQDRLMQVMANLLSNAAKYSAKGDIVELQLSRHGQFIRVAVRDHGPGIPQEFRNKIFGKFAQADSSDTREKGGTGLGLNISKVIVEHHGGSIGYETEIGKGTVVYFDLPPYELFAVDDRINSGHLLDCRDESFCSSQLKSSTVSGIANILHVEDDPDIAQVVEGVVGNTGSITLARSFSDARFELEKDLFDLVILDIGLPDGRGDKLFPLMKTTINKETPVIIFSSLQTSKKLDDSIKATLLKSQTSNDELLRVIHCAVRSRK